MRKKPVVWYVDDLPQNLQKFKANHESTFTIRLFERPADVLSALDKEQPDALLCDIFFYETVEKAKEMEEKVQERARELRHFGAEIGASSIENQAGVKLIQEVSGRFPEKFPIYAYTSKGPYLLEGSGFDEIAEARGRWLFKGKYGPATLQLILRQDIQEFRVSNSLQMRLARYFWMFFFGSGLLGGLVVWFLTEELPKLVRSW
jgi:hypothetical protein